MNKIKIEPVKLYNGCILAAIVHAVMVGEYPELNYEHSWDGINYNMNNGQGCRATITFHSKHIVAVFQNMEDFRERKETFDYFRGASKEIIEIAKKEALQYVLEDINGIVQPVITGAFWGGWEQLFSNQTWDNFMEAGGFILQNQMLDYQNALIAWDDYYGFNNEQLSLIDSLYQKKRYPNSDAIQLNKDEIKYLYGDIEECREALGELHIYFGT
ncbi:MAG: hypothetical protein K2N90_10220 [Lachnospiraceae bacterium]|nr:hypothetical protein [Lachnospiraceae bacterium]